jgi:hypothetical protein
MKLFPSPWIEFTAIALLGGGLVFGARQYEQNLIPPSLPRDHPIQVEARRLEKVRLSQLAFRKYVEAVRQDIAWKGLPLMDGAKRVEAYCQENYPLYLGSFAKTAGADRLLERIARNLISDFQDEVRAPARKWPPNLMHRLEKEMRWNAPGAPGQATNHSAPKTP